MSAPAVGTWADEGGWYAWVYPGTDLDGYGTYAVPSGTVLDMSSSALAGRDVEAYVTGPGGRIFTMLTPSYSAANGHAPTDHPVTFTVPGDGWTVQLSDWGAFDPATGGDVGGVFPAVSWVPAGASSSVASTAFDASTAVEHGVDTVGGDLAVIAPIAAAVGFGLLGLWKLRTVAAHLLGGES